MWINRHIYFPGQKKRTIPEIGGEKNAVPSCDIMQKPWLDADDPALRFFARDRACYHKIEQCSSHRESWGRFFFFFGQGCTSTGKQTQDGGSRTSHSQCTLMRVLNRACAHYVMVSKFQWKPFWLATQRDPQNDWTVTQNRVNYDVFAQAP